MKRFYLALFSLLAFLTVLPFSVASGAGANDFTVNSFSVDYDLSNAQNGGRLVTTEDIDLTFAGYNHGILRALPIDYKGWNTKIKVDKVLRDGAEEKYSTYEQNGNLVLKIGQADKTMTGHHVYKLVYEQRHVVNFEGPNPEFFWDVNGTEWEQPFTLVKAAVHLPKDALAEKKPVCFTGTFRSTVSDCEFTSADGLVTFNTTKGLQPRENLTIAVPLEHGIFNPPGKLDLIKDHIDVVLGLAAGLAIAAGAIVLWMIRGRDYAGRGVIIPEYDPPQDITPGELGLLADYRVDSRDITATMIDLAIRGYLRIHEDKKKVLFVSKRNYKLELMMTDFSALKDHEKEVLAAIFGTGSTAGQIVEVGKIDKMKMSKAVNEIKKQLQKDLTEKYGYFEKDAKKLGNTMSIIGGIMLFASFFLFSISAAAIGAVIGGLVLLVVGQVMPRRSHAGVEVYEDIQGLKLYMNTAEKDRLKMLQSVDRPYAEPSKTVELYEKLLPYAIALGVEKSWTKQFDGVLRDAPDWYSGSNFHAFNAAVFASSIGSVNSSFGSSFSSSSSSGSGGFSGGGGGGGGGGGW